MTDPSEALARGVERCSYCRAPYWVEHYAPDHHTFTPIHSVTAEAADREVAGEPLIGHSPAQSADISAAADPPCCDCLCGNCGAAYAAALRGERSVGDA